MMKNASAQSGNMLLYILGAILLMGLLIVALKGSFQEGSGIDAEKVAIQVAEVQRYGAELERGVAYILSNGYSETDLRFAHPNAASTYGLITDIPARQVFSSTGGGVEYRSPPVGLQIGGSNPWSFSARSEIAGVGATCALNRCVELVAYLPLVSKEFCLKLNDADSITNPSGSPPVEPDGFTWSGAFLGSYTIDGTSQVNTTGGYANGNMEGCVNHSTDYYYYRVLLAR